MDVLAGLAGVLHALIVVFTISRPRVRVWLTRMVPVWEVLEFKWLRRQSSSFVRRRNILRAGVVLGTGVTALVVPNFGLFVSLIGSRWVGEQIFRHMR